MKTKLITALRLTAHKLETGELPYEWMDAGRCNCGVLAQQLLGISDKDLWPLIHQSPDSRDASCEFGPWGVKAAYCSVSGVSFPTLFKSLFEAGLEIKDFNGLECLTDQNVLRRLGRSMRRNNKADVIAYMRAWADLLVEEGNAVEPPPRALPNSACATPIGVSVGGEALTTV